MNERIKALVDKTAELMPGVYSLGYESGKKGVEFTEDALEKFAELIVRECAEVAQMNTPDTEECEYTHLISEKIREHFRVEE
jgi:hypothetical protein